MAQNCKILLMDKRKLKLVCYYILLLILILGLFGVIYLIIQNSNNIALISTLAAIYFLNLIFNIIVFTQDRPNETRQSWIIVFISLPLIGHILYIIFGQKYSKVLSFEDYVKERNSFLQNNKTYELNESINCEKLQKIAKMNAKNIYPAKIITFDNGHFFFQELFNQLKKAKKFIFLETYIIKPGEIFEELKQILISKVSEGLEVKIIVDDFGSWDLPRSTFKELENLGIKIVQFEKIPFPFITGNANYRSHRKFVIIDGNYVFTGGCNISDEYANFSKKYGIWKDANISLQGPIVEYYTRLFGYDWYKQSGKKIGNIESYFLASNNEHNEYENAITTIEDGPACDFPFIESTMIKMLSEADKSIKLSTPYFIPSKRLSMALSDALAQGIDITLYIPGLWDKAYVYFATISCLKPLIKLGLKVKLVKNCFLHSKIALVDDELAYLGTLNLDHRSFYTQFEVTNFYSGEATKDIKYIFETYNRLHDEKQLKKLLNKKNGLIAKYLLRIFKPVL
ncbi:cardiolipin synthase [Mycoplasma sp. 128]